MDGSIFISYRRGDGPGFAGRLYDRLEQEFSPERVFLDVDNIAPGLDFVEVLSSKVAACDVLLAIIGRNWAEARDGNGDLRLHNPDDFVRIEIEQALALKKRVIPVLVDGADMPQRKAVPLSLQPLLRRNAVRLTHEGFRSDVDRLVAALEEAMADIHKPRKAGAPPKADKQPGDAPDLGDAPVKKTDRARGQKKDAIGTIGAESIDTVNRPVKKDGNKAGTVPGRTPAEMQAWQKEQQEKDEKFKLARLKAAEEHARVRAGNQPPPPPPIVAGLNDAGVRTPGPEAASPGPSSVETPSRVSRRVVLGGVIVGAAAAAWFSRGSWLPGGGGEVRTIKEPVRIVSDQLMIHDVDFAPLGQSFVTGGEQGNLSVWSSTGTDDFKLEGHTDRITKTVFSPDRDRRRLLTVSVDGKAFIRSGERYLDAIPLQGHSPALGAGWRRYGSHVAIGGSDVTVWDAQTGKLVSTIEGHRGPVLDLAYAPWGDVLATASEDGTAQLWDAVGFGHFATFNPDAGAVFGVVVSPIDGHFVTLSKGNRTIVWSWGRIGALTSTQLETRKEIVAAEFSPDGQQLVTGALDGTADLWRVTGEHIARLEGHQGPLTSTRFSPSGALILTTSWDKTARLWNRETQATVAILTGHSSAVTDAKFSSDGNFALTRSDDLSARVWGIPSDLVLT